MKAELHERKDYLQDKKISSIYFGGGTPSLLTSQEIMGLIEHAYRLFDVIGDAEITLEANPDDLSQAKIKELKSTAVNRFSIGVQSFFSEDLQYMHRAHNPEQAESSVKRAQDAGFVNITLDLIYGFPLLTDEKWRSNLIKATGLGVPHLSCYGMTVEPGTAMDKLVRKGRKPPMNEEQSARQFEYLMNFMEKSGFIQYEISNFGKEGFFSKHNSAYWEDVHYLGIGPSAHSYDGNSRRWNVSDNKKYILSRGREHEVEALNEKDKHNEYVMTGLRTMYGVEESKIKNQREIIENHLKTGMVIRQGNKLILSRKGKLIADRIASDLFL